MDAARIAALLDPFLDRPLPIPALEQISIYIDLLLRWNARINLTAVRDPEQIVTRHFGESFFLARHLFPETVARTHSSAHGPDDAAQTFLSEKGGDTVEPTLLPANHGRPDAHDVPQVLDLGSGAGFPALPLKIWSPDIRLTLVESNHKKAAFLREAIRSLTLMSVNVIADRVETLPTPIPPRYDVVTLRAIERLDLVLPLTLRLLAATARIALLTTTPSFQALQTLTSQIDWRRPINVPHSHSRILAIGVRRA